MVHSEKGVTVIHLFFFRFGHLIILLFIVWFIILKLKQLRNAKRSGRFVTTKRIRLYIRTLVIKIVEKLQHCESVNRFGRNAKRFRMGVQNQVFMRILSVFMRILSVFDRIVKRYVRGEQANKCVLGIQKSKKRYNYKITQQIVSFIKIEISKCAYLRLREIQKIVKSIFDIDLSKSSICKCLKISKITRKKSKKL